MPTWLKRLACTDANGVMSYEDLRDIYIYLRSIQKMIVGTKCGNQAVFFDQIQKKLDYLFSTKGFGAVSTLHGLLYELIRGGIGPQIAFKERQSEVGILKQKWTEKPAVKRGSDFLMRGARLTRARNWQYRLEVAIEEAIEHNWYPLFGTYTVDGKRLPRGCLSRDDLWKTTPVWDRFVKKFKTEIAEAAGYGRRPSKWPPVTLIH